MIDEFKFLEKCVNCNNYCYRYRTHYNDYEISCDYCSNTNIIISDSDVISLHIIHNNGCALKYNNRRELLIVSRIINNSSKYYTFELSKFDIKLLKVIYSSDPDNLLENIEVYLLFS